MAQIYRFEFVSQGDGVLWELFFEQDDFTAYAYLRKGKAPTCWVWLYNLSSELRSPQRGQPVTNLAGRTLPARLEPATKASEVEVGWGERPWGVMAEIFLRDCLLGVLSSQEPIGWATLALKNSDVARVLRESGRMLIDVSVTNGETGAVVRVQDNGDVAYAYYLLDGQVTGLVWLYNRIDAPESPPWERDDAEDLRPLLNPIGYARADSDPPLASSDLDFRFRQTNGAWTCGIFVRGRLHAIVGDGTFPGWCRLAAQDSPLALTF